jgi:hypothetical protein
MCVDAEGSPASFRGSVNLQYITEVMDRFGLADRWSLIYGGGREVAGVERAEVIETARRSALLLNVMGFLNDEEILAAAPRPPRHRPRLRLWAELGLARPFDGHDRHVTVGGWVGDPECAIPTCGLDWVRTPPVASPSAVTPSPPSGRPPPSDGTAPELDDGDRPRGHHRAGNRNHVPTLVGGAKGRRDEHRQAADTEQEHSDS